MKRVAWAVVVMATACGRSGAGPETAPATTATATAPATATATASATASASATPSPSCGTKLGDWCPAPAGDPCGAHRDEPSCRADARCKGLPYRGESLVACKADGKGFWSNCPAVGCVTK